TTSPWERRHPSSTPPGFTASSREGTSDGTPASTSAWIARSASVRSSSVHGAASGDTVRTTPSSGSAGTTCVKTAIESASAIALHRLAVLAPLIIRLLPLVLDFVPMRGGSQPRPGLWSRPLHCRGGAGEEALAEVPPPRMSPEARRHSLSGGSSRGARERTPLCAGQRLSWQRFLFIF